MMATMTVIMKMIDPAIVYLTHCQPHYIFYFILITLWDRHYNSTFTESKFSSVQSFSHVQLFVTSWTTACQASLSITNSRTPPKHMSTESVMVTWCEICHPAISFSVIPFSSYPQSFPASGSFQMSQLSTSVGQSIGVSTSVLPMNIQDWFPLG